MIGLQLHMYVYLFQYNFPNGNFIDCNLIATGNLQLKPVYGTLVVYSGINSINAVMIVFVTYFTRKLITFR